MEIEFVAVMQVEAREPITGVTCPLGFLSHDGKWMPVEFVEPGTPFTPQSLASWLTDDAGTLFDPECLGDKNDEKLKYYSECIAETKVRLKQMALDILERRSPTVESLHVWLASGVECAVKPGEYVPRDARHVHNGGAWVEIGIWIQAHPITA